jgi:hypothetical protein
MRRGCRRPSVPAEEEVDRAFEMDCEPRLERGRARAPLGAAVPRDRGGAVPDPADPAEPGADVDVLEIHEPAVVDAAGALERTPADQQCRAGEALDVALDVVRRARERVRVDPRPCYEPAEAERAHRGSQDAGEATRAEQLDAAVSVDELRSDSDDVRVGVEARRERAQRTGLEPHVRVDDE